jgi:heat shock protein HtpX
MTCILLFVATNLAIMLVLGVVLSLVGYEGFLDAQGVNLNLQSTLIFAGIFGMGGSFISLAMSKWMAKRSTGARLIDPPQNKTDSG